MLSVFVFLFCSHSAAQVTLAFVFVKNSPDLPEKRRIKSFEPLADILVNRAFAHSESLRRLPYGGAFLRYV